MKLRMIEREEVPCWFELSWQEEEPALLLKIHETRIPDFKALTPANPWIQGILKESPEFRSFVGLRKGSPFGFNRALGWVDERNGFLVWKATLPKICVEIDQICSRCNGSKQEPYHDGVCLECRGSGKRHVYEWKEAYAVSASLTVLLSLLEYPGEDEDTSAPFPQLLNVTTVTLKGMGGGSLHGTYSRILCEWLRKVPLDTQIPEAVQAMQIAYIGMMGFPPILKRQFKAFQSGNGWLIIDCPGDACGLHPSESWVRKGEGYRFSCHNVDTPAQQLTLLAGLAALHDRARRELNSAS